MSSQASITTSSAEIEIATGRLRGTRTGRVAAFKGVPYSGPVSGARRFRRAPPVLPWKGYRSADAIGPRAFQDSNNFGFSHELLAVMPPSSQRMDEDCLTLNVWTPALHETQLRPVMVWLHGGAFIQGTAWYPWHDGAELAQCGEVIVVSLCHRLGAFGFLYLHELGGDEFEQSGIVGMLDIVDALKWIRGNIAAFGGDPNRITVFGHSGGGAKISALLAMPEAHGLFHQAMIQSGPALEFITVEEAAATTRSMLQELGISAADYRQLGIVPAEKLLQAQQGVLKRLAGMPFVMRRRVGFNPVVGGKDQPSHPFVPGASALAANIPLVIGTTKDEMSMFLYNKPWANGEDEGSVRAAAEGVLGLDGGQALRVLNSYGEARPTESMARNLIAAASDRCFRNDSLLIADRKVAGGAGPVFTYLFTWETPALEGRLRSAHTLEAPFVFNQPRVAPLAGGREGGRLAELMSASWAAFAHTGSPQTPALPLWTRHDAERRPTMVFNEECSLQNDPMRGERLAWVGVT